MEQAKTFEQWWDEYPRKEHRKRALEIWTVLSTKNRSAACSKLSTDKLLWDRERRERKHIPLPDTYLQRIAAAPQPVYADQQPLPRAPYPTPQQKEARRREMEQWRQRLGAKP